MAPRLCILVLSLLTAAGAAAAQVVDPQAIGQQNQDYMQQQAQQRQALDQERQAFVQEQNARTDQALYDLSAARRGEPAPFSLSQPPRSAALAARADTLRRLADEIAARPSRLIVKPRGNEQSP